MRRNVVVEPRVDCARAKPHKYGTANRHRDMHRKTDDKHADGGKQNRHHRYFARTEFSDERPRNKTYAARAHRGDYHIYACETFVHVEVNVHDRPRRSEKRIGKPQRYENKIN